MSEEMLVCHCSPTLAGLKTGSLFSCPYSSQKMIIKEIREFNQKLTQKGIRIIPVRISDKRMLVYVYRPEKLKEDFSDEKTQIILKCKGYDCTNPSQCICRLIQKLQSDPDFPHEIGLFLGYPAEAVLFTSDEFDVSMMDSYDAIAFGCPAMGAEVLEEEEFEPMFASCESKLSGKRIALFGSYGWGDGEWMRDWETRCKEAGAVLICESVICNEMPDDEGIQSCKALGENLD